VIAEGYLQQFSEEEETPILVADSALYAADNLRQLAQQRWVSRVPATIAEAKSLLTEVEQEQMHSSERDGYFYHETGLSDV